MTFSDGAGEITAGTTGPARRSTSRGVLEEQEEEEGWEMVCSCRLMISISQFQSMPQLITKMQRNDQVKKNKTKKNFLYSFILILWQLGTFFLRKTFDAYNFFIQEEFPLN